MNQDAALVSESQGGGGRSAPLAERRQTIAVCMIVRNEAAVIGRCLASVRPLIDAWVICDTGSTDGTQERIRQALSGLPGELHEVPWRDFAFNRTEALELAREAADYLLVLDADHTLRIGAPLPDLTADAYLVRHDGDLDHWIPHLIRNDRRWWYESPVHEYLATDGAHTREPLDAIAIEHHADGGSRDRRAWDAKVLERELRRDPQSQRATFYLAQTYAELGEDTKAIELYRRRAELGGWDQEVFYALYRAGALLARHDPEAAVPALLEAWQRRPSRAEPLYELAQLCRSAGWHEAAYVFARRGLEIPYPDDILFVHRPVYVWSLLFELGIAAYWVGRTDEALSANDRLLEEGLAPASIEPQVRENRWYCLERLGRHEPRPPFPHDGPQPLAVLAPSTELGEIRLEVEPAWSQFNPSIARDGGGFRLLVRTSNYRYEEGEYRLFPGERVFRNLYYLVALDREFSLTDVWPVVDREVGPARFPGQLEGYEDPRLIQLAGGWVASASVRDRNPEGRCEMALLALEGAQVTAVRLLAGPTPGRVEKNWMPFVADQALHFVYSCSPTVALRCNPASGDLERIAEHPAPAGAAGYRGGSQGLAVDGGTLFVVHEVSLVSGLRRYSHRFVLLDREYRLGAASPPFRFFADGLEFCAGLAQRDRQLVLSFGVGDQAAGLAVLDEQEALALLEPCRLPSRGRSAA